MLEAFFRQLSTEPDSISFQQTITLIDAVIRFHSDGVSEW